ncbi:glycosyltransferase family 2 protein, partial [Brevundimonas sp.]|uniref:glycosyltransferase family 2 protein n=1 Tax=Brevundimonas sp. TaxID=1871086 RepID=UPI0035B45B7F
MSRAGIHDNTGRARARPSVSVLIPFLRDDPTDLLGRLDAEAAALHGRVEIVLLDDGTADAALTARLVERVSAMALPARLITLLANEGRARGRNRLASAARGGSLLFLDSDMRPDRPDFLQTWA